jgi:hypothetical protein
MRTARALARIIKRALADPSGGSETIVPLLWMGMGATVISLSCPTIFESGQACAQTLRTQVNVLERGASPGGGVGFGFNLGGSGWNFNIGFGPGGITGGLSGGVGVAGVSGTFAGGGGATVGVNGGGASVGIRGGGVSGSAGSPGKNGTGSKPGSPAAPLVSPPPAPPPAPAPRGGTTLTT